MRNSFAGFGCAALFGMGLIALGSPVNAESVMKMCGDQWQAAKAAGTTNGETWPKFLAQCREQQKAASMGSGAAPAPSAQPAPAPAPAPTPSTYSSSPTPTGAGEFASEAQARSRCPSDTVVWVNT